MEDLQVGWFLNPYEATWGPDFSTWGPEWGKDFADNQARFAYFCKAALKAIQDTTKEGEVDPMILLVIGISGKVRN